MNPEGIWLGLLVGSLTIGLIEAIKGWRNSNRELERMDAERIPTKGEQ